MSARRYTGGTTPAVLAVVLVVALLLLVAVGLFAWTAAETFSTVP